MVKLEVCVDTLDSALAAEAGGAQRLELCAGLDVGGLTPGVGLMKSVVRQSRLPVHVLIRPRAGDFCYSEAEIAMMESDIAQARELGAAGAVFGALTEEGHVDVTAIRRLKKAAASMALTFHRAFDLTVDPWTSLDVLIDEGFHYMLSSGQAASAMEGKELLRNLAAACQGRLEVMPGSGITPENAGLVARETNVSWLHASARSTSPGPMIFRRSGLSMGSQGQDEFVRMRTDVHKVKAIIAACQG